MPARREAQRGRRIQARRGRPAIAWRQALTLVEQLRQRLSATEREESNCIGAMVVGVASSEAPAAVLRFGGGALAAARRHPRVGGLQPDTPVTALVTAVELEAREEEWQRWAVIVERECVAGSGASPRSARRPVQHAELIGMLEGRLTSELDAEL